MMRAEFWAVLTAICWAGGAFFEKRGVRLGGFAPVMGTTIRTVASVVLLAVLSYPFWGQLRTSGLRPILMIVVGGGVVAGAMGILFFYSALASGNLSTVLPIAFCLTPVLGVLIGVLVLKEQVLPIQYVGISLAVAGAALTVYFKA
jgi:transporter family protein